VSLREFRILLIDDDEDDFVNIRYLLQDIRSSRYKLNWVSTYADGLRALRNKEFDACLLDYRLGEKTGLDLLVEAHAKGFSKPVIFLTGLIDFEIDIRAMQMGASDYLVKGQLTSPLLERSIRYAVKHHHDLVEIREGKAQIIQQDRMASLGLLASSLAHEIGTPLGIIRSRAEMAQKKVTDNENLKRDMEIIVFQIDRITKLVNSLLNIAREKKSEVGSTVDFNKVLQDTLGLLQHEFDRKGILFHVNLEKEFKIKAEAGPLAQVLINLLINAVHAIEEAKKNNVREQSSEITLSVTENGNQVEIIISDTGTGIPEENLRHIFKPFFTTKDIGSGTGLGLATSMSIVNSWGGEISVSSQVRKGSTFRIFLPKA